MEKSGGRPCIYMPRRNEVCARIPVKSSQFGVVRYNKEADASSPCYETQIAERYPYIEDIRTALYPRRGSLLSSRRRKNAA